MREPKLFEKEDPKEELRGFAIISALIGIIILVTLGLYDIRGLFIALFNIIGNILENIFRNVSLPAISAIVFFIMSGILGFGLLLEDEDDVNIYKRLVDVLWSITLLVFALLLSAYGFGLIPLSAVIGPSFVLFISPLIIFIIYKGLIFLLSKF